VVFIHGFQDTAAPWDGVMVRLAAPRWRARAVNLRHVDDADPGRRGVILEGHRDQVLDVLDAIDPTAQRPVVVDGHSMGTQVGGSDPQQLAHQPAPAGFSGHHLTSTTERTRK
jgi:pimeloyl-ACP methyl ester carboxylesterase